MKLLLSNDDGIYAAGIQALTKGLADEHTIFISAPDTERSAVSRSMTLFSPLRARPVQLDGLPEVPAYAVNGTPVDCVRLGLGNLFETPDMVISGVNIGHNLGTDVLYSGTVGAAHEASLLGYQAMAISICSFEPAHFETAVYAAKWGVRYLTKHPLPIGTVLNINVPDIPVEEVKGFRPCSTGVVGYTLKYVERKDPSDKTYYWPPRGRVFDQNSPKDCDERAIMDGYISVTPLGYDLTNYDLLAAMDPSESMD